VSRGFLLWEIIDINREFAMRKLVSCLFVLLFAMQSFAGGWQAATTKVTSYDIEGGDAGERIYVSFDKVFNPDNCPNAPQLARIYGDTAKGKYMFSIIMAAKAANQVVSVNYSGCDDWGRPILYAISVQP